MHVVLQLIIFSELIYKIKLIFIFPGKFHYTYYHRKSFFYINLVCKYVLYYIYLRNNISQTVILLLNNVTVWSSDARNYITRA
jgi:hypothetical protein